MDGANPQKLEQQLTELLMKFHREQQGHSPVCHSTILPGMAVAVSTGIFTSTEKTLCGSMEGQKLIQSARREQRALTRRDVESQVSKLLQRPISRSYYDLDVRSGEQVEIYILD